MALIVKSGGFCVGDVCTVGAGEAFTLSVEIVAAPADYVIAQSYIGFGTDLSYNPTGVAADEVVWSECDASLVARSQVNASSVNHGCLTGLFSPLPVSNYTGNFIDLSMNCSQGESSTEVRLLPKGDPEALDNGAAFVLSDNTNVVPNVRSVTVDCVVPPTATPTPENSPTSTSTPDPTDTPSAPTPTPILLPTLAPATQVPTSTPTWTPTAPPTATATSTRLPTNTRTPTPTVLVGDASCDGVVNPLDAALILQFAAGLTPALPCPSGGDANGDGVTNPLDAALILQFSAGMISTLPP